MSEMVVNNDCILLCGLFRNYKFKKQIFFESLNFNSHSSFVSVVIFDVSKRRCMSLSQFYFTISIVQ